MDWLNKGARSATPPHHIISDRTNEISYKNFWEPGMPKRLQEEKEA